MRHITSYLEEYHPAKKDSRDSITINLSNISKFMPFELRFYDNIIDNHLETHSLISQVVEQWCGRKRDIFYDSPLTHHIGTTKFERVNHHKMGKLLKFKGIVDSYQSFVSIPTTYFFECPSCGKHYTSTRKVIRGCECGRKDIKYNNKEVCSRMFFQLMEKTKSNTSGLVKCYYEVKGMEYEKYIFNSSYIGEEVEMLGTPREVETIVNNKESIYYVIELRGIKKLKRRVVTKERKEEIIETIKKETNAYKNLALSMSCRVYKHEILRQLAFATAVGLFKPDKDLGNDINTAFNQLWIGDPSVGKSYVAKQFLPFFPKSAYAQGVSTRAVGLLGGCDKVKDGGFIIRTGLVQRANNSFIILDELDKIGEDAQKGLFTALSEGKHTLTNITGSTEFEYNTGFLLIGNPKGGKFDMMGGAKYTQIDLDPAFLSRADVVTIVDKPYLDENGKFDKDMWDKYVKYSSKRFKPNPHFDKDFLLDYVEIVKEQPNPKTTPEVQIAMEKYFTKKKLQVMDVNVNDYDDAQNLQKKTIDERFMNSLHKLTKIIGRATFCETTTIEHFWQAVELLEKGMLDMLMKKGMEDLRASEEYIAEQHRKTIPMTASEKIKELEYLIPLKEPIEFMELVKKANDIGITEREIDEMLPIMARKGDIMENVNGKRGYYMRVA